MRKTAKVFMTNRSQAVRLPKEFQFDTNEVYIRKEGDEVVLSPRPTDWGDYFDTRVPVSPDFMDRVEDPPPQDRSWWWKDEASGDGGTE